MEPLEGAIRRYAWGSRYQIAQLQGRATPTPHPEAELWLGDHSAAPAVVRRADGPCPLPTVISADPVGVLGAHTAAVFGPRLPYLLKVLAAAAPLSLQAHPDADQAARGFAAEEAAGIPIGAPNRTYVDPWHKPELLVAVTEFRALCGFQAPKLSADLLAELNLPILEPIVTALRAADEQAALRAAVHRLLTTPADQVVDLVGAVVAAAQTRSTHHEGYALIGRLAAEYPGDVGTVVAMLLNQVTLRPGEAVWMPAGNLHAYLEGMGVEIMAASDNVLRGGMTPKYVNVPELLRVLRFEPLRDPVLRGRSVADDLITWPVPTTDFVLMRATPRPERPVTLPGGGPRVLLCISGTVDCVDRDGAVGRRLTLRCGGAAFVPASDGPVTVTGLGEVYQANIG